MSNRSALKVLRAHVANRAEHVVDRALTWRFRGEPDTDDHEGKLIDAIDRYREARALLEAAEGNTP